MSAEIIKAQWPLKSRIQVVVTTRMGGCSAPPYESLNMAQHVHDDKRHVQENRHRVASALVLPNEPMWLNQVHGHRVLTDTQYRPGIEADGMIVTRPQTVAAIMTADCLPVVIAHQSENFGVALHCGWRSLAAGIIETAMGQLPQGRYSAWLGPAISHKHFQVGDDVREVFSNKDEQLTRCFTPDSDTLGKWYLDLYQVARGVLAAAGVSAVFGGDFCTYSDRKRFFSYRRDGLCGRMATLVWF